MEITLKQLLAICNESLKVRIHDCYGNVLGLRDRNNTIDTQYNDRIVIYQNVDWLKRELYVELNID